GKENKEEKIKQRQSSAYTRDQLVDFLLQLMRMNVKVERKPKNVLVDDITKRQNTESQLPRYTCEGSVLITIKRSHGLAYICLHHLPHPQPRSIAVSSEIKEYIQQNKLLTVPQIYHNIKTLGLNGYIYVTRQQIYYWCKRLGINEYKMAEDQIESTIQYLLQQTMFKLIIQQLTIIAFTTPLFDVFPKEQITVIAVDATYNTNWLKYELYMILGIIDGAGFPLTHLLLKPDQEEKHSKILLNWFYLIKEQGIRY
ncbi:35153_t:CDS:2, partial [Gigaspora margarita]